MRELTSLTESDRKIALDRYHLVASLPDRTQRLPCSTNFSATCWLFR